MEGLRSTLSWLTDRRIIFCLSVMSVLGCAETDPCDDETDVSVISEDMGIAIDGAMGMGGMVVVEEDFFPAPDSPADAAVSDVPAYDLGVDVGVAGDTDETVAALLLTRQVYVCLSEWARSEEWCRSYSGICEEEPDDPICDGAEERCGYPYGDFVDCLDGIEFDCDDGAFDYFSTLDDADGDGLSNRHELFELYYDPCNPCTPLGDGLCDAERAAMSGVVESGCSGIPPSSECG